MTELSAREAKQADAYLRAENAKHPIHLRDIPRDQWPQGVNGHARVLRSRDFLVQVFEAKDGATRLSICRSRLLRSGRWDDGITWDELQRLKAEAGFADSWAVEIFPPSADVVNVANMRHLWIVARRPPFAWSDAK
jgi:hypothetical protein